MDPRLFLYNMIIIITSIVHPTNKCIYPRGGPLYTVLYTVVECSNEENNVNLFHQSTINLYNLRSQFFSSLKVAIPYTVYCTVQSASSELYRTQCIQSASSELYRTHCTVRFKWAIPYTLYSPLQVSYTVHNVQSASSELAANLDQPLFYNSMNKRNFTPYFNALYFKAFNALLTI